LFEKLSVSISPLKVFQDLKTVDGSGFDGHADHLPKRNKTTSVYTTRKLTWNPNMVFWKIIFFFKGVIFRIHVSFGGSKHGVNHMRVITGNISHKDGHGSQWTLAF